MKARRKLFIYEFLAAPAHMWLWVVGRLFGMRFECAPGGPWSEGDNP